MEDGAALRVVERGRAVEEAEEEGDRGDARDDLEAEAPRIEAEMGESNFQGVELSTYPAFVQDSGPLFRPFQRPSIAGSRNTHFYSLLDGCCLFTRRGPKSCPKAGY